MPLSTQANDQREAAGEVIAGTAVEPHPRAVLAGNDAESILLNLMQPQAAGRQRVGFGGEVSKSAWLALSSSPLSCNMFMFAIGDVGIDPAGDQCMPPLWRVGGTSIVE
jgi:hypothetical protein